MKPVLTIFSTGGTIASTFQAHGRAAAALGADDLRRYVEDFQDRVEIRTVDVARVQSSQLTLAVLQQLADTIGKTLEADDTVGCVVTHGTLTMQESAYLVDLLLNAAKPVIFTGAMVTADRAGSDGPANLRNAVRAALSPEAGQYGVLVCFNGELHLASRVVKTHSSAVNAFSSPGFGPAGIVDEDRVLFHHPPLPRIHLPIARLRTDVDVIPAVLDASDKLLRCSVESRPDGIVIEGFPGRGSVPSSFMPLIARAVAEGIPVVLTSRALEGRILPKYGGGTGGADLADLGVIFARGLPASKARLLLMVARSYTDDLDQIREIFARFCP